MKSAVMVLALAAYVHASIRTPEHKFDSGFAFVLFVADLVVAGAMAPSF